jgi:Peptidase family M23
MPTGRTALSSLVVALAGLACAPGAVAGIPDHILFPVVGEVTYTNDFGDPRPGGSHQGNDLMGKRMQYAVAAEAGRVEKRRSVSGSYSSCYLVLRGKSGTHYWYIHLNNDVPGGPANDNQGGCRNRVSWPRGLRQDQWVRAGQIVGFVGDSGDANGIQPHLHFEVHPRGGGAVNPYRHLNRARRLLYAAPASVDSVRLRMRGVVRDTRSRLRIRTRVVRSSAGRSFRVTKYVALDVAANAVVERQAQSGQIRTATLASAELGDRVVVWTKYAAPTLATQQGLPGVWHARRIRLLTERR